MVGTCILHQLKWGVLWVHIWTQLSKPLGDMLNVVDLLSLIPYNGYSQSTTASIQLENSCSMEVDDRAELGIMDDATVQVNVQVFFPTIPLSHRH